MFLLRGGVFPSYESQLDEIAFQRGYGAVQQNPWLIAWYRYTWVIQELTEFGRQIIEAEDPRSETAVDGLRRFQALFDAGDVIDLAKRSDPSL